jgi:hypothetical protein
MPSNPSPEAPSSLPRPRMLLIGRERELTAIRTLLMRDDVPLVTLERVMDLGEGVSSGNEHIPQTLPERRDRRRMGLRGPLPDAAGRGRPATPVRVARGLQRLALAGPDWVAVALPAQRPAALAGGLPADPALAGRRVPRDHGRRLAGAAAGGGGARSATDGGDCGRTDPASPPRRAAIGRATTATSTGTGRSCTPPSTPWATSWPPASRQRMNKNGRRWRRWPPRCSRSRATPSRWPSSTRATPDPTPPKRPTPTGSAWSW